MSSGLISRSIAETHYQLGVAQAHCEDFVNAEKSLKAAISVLDKRVVNLKKMEVSENIKKELAELDTLCYDIKERMNDHKDMQKGVYKQDKDFVSVFKSKFLLISLIELKLNISPRQVLMMVLSPPRLVSRPLLGQLPRGCSCMH